MSTRKHSDRNRRRFGSLCALALMLVALPPARAQEIDRLLAAVNGRVITASDLRMARMLNLVMAYGRQTENRAPEAELERVIDLELLRRELESSPAVQPDAARLDEALAALRRGYAELGGLPGLLERLGLAERELREYVALLISVDNFVGSRFRPFLPIPPEEVKAHYESKLVPQLQRAGARVPPLAEVSAEIEKLLREEKVQPALEQWLAEVRRHSRIELFTATQLPEAARPAEEKPEAERKR